MDSIFELPSLDLTQTMDFDMSDFMNYKKVSPKFLEHNFDMNNSDFSFAGDNQETGSSSPVSNNNETTSFD
jgi:hypothetical protein